MGTGRGKYIRKRTVPRIRPIDGRCQLAKRMKARRKQVLADIGCEDGSLTATKAALVDRWCWMVDVVERMEADLAAGGFDKPDALSKYAAAANCLNGLAKSLGLERADDGLPPTPDDLEGLA